MFLDTSEHAISQAAVFIEDAAQVKYIELFNSGKDERTHENKIGGGVNEV